MVGEITQFRSKRTQRVFSVDEYYRSDYDFKSVFKKPKLLYLLDKKQRNGYDRFEIYSVIYKGVLFSIGDIISGVYSVNTQGIIAAFKLFPETGNIQIKYLNKSIISGKEIPMTVLIQNAALFKSATGGVCELTSIEMPKK